MHGRTSEVQHHGSGLFAGVPSPLTVCRYHSLLVDESTLGNDFEVTAHTADGEIMAIAHRRRPVFGVQFHPEATLTEYGYTLLANFLRLAGLMVTETLPQSEVEVSAEVENDLLVDWPLPGAATSMSRRADP
jgi:GMP synthase-like glutamine amidotransferase